MQDMSQKLEKLLRIGLRLEFNLKQAVNREFQECIAPLNFHTRPPRLGISYKFFRLAQVNQQNMTIGFKPKLKMQFPESNLVWDIFEIGLVCCEP